MALRKSEKSPDEFDGLTPTKQVRLDKYDRGVNNNKFWHGSVFELGGSHYFVRRWGRNGTKGQGQVEVGSQWDCESELHDLERKKRKDGYTNDPSLLEKMAREVVE